MTPERLEMINVMSHVHTIVPFDKIRAACIQGINGAGKSAIPEAILLALFGECSRGKGPDVIRLGETEMTIIYDFEKSGLFTGVSENGPSPGLRSNLSWSSRCIPTRRNRLTGK